MVLNTPFGWDKKMVPSIFLNRKIVNYTKINLFTLYFLGKFKTRAIKDTTATKSVLEVLLLINRSA